MMPFLKWAGGKRWLFTSEFVASLPKYNRYIEPFLGGAAGFFALEPEQAVLSDVNKDLIELYEVVRDHPFELQHQMAQHQKQHSKEYYYITRATLPNTKIQRAARTLYLNRTCWNGLYRLNRKGEFNVPIGSKNSVVLETDDFAAVSKLLSKSVLLFSDFENTVDMAKEGDLVFVDPPYTVKHNFNGFVKYNESIFSWEDQERLKDSLFRAKERGAIVIVTNADHKSVRDLYTGSENLMSVNRRSVISGKNNGRGNISELLVTV